MGMFGDATNSGVLRWPKSFAAQVPAVELAASALQIQALIDEIQSATLRAKEFIENRTQAELTTSPGPTSWSVAQCLDHLAKTTNAFLQPISEAISRTPRLTTNRRLQTGFITRVLVRTLEPPYKLHFKVFAPIAPSQESIEPAWNAFAESQELLASAVRSSTGLAIDKIHIESPVYTRLSYNVYGALRMLAAHQRRHLWQMEQVLNALDRIKSPSIP